MKSTGNGSGVKDLALKIERDINFGHISPGSWLKQIDLEQTYGVSRLSVRQALERLAERGHVELSPNRGYRVRIFDPQRFSNIVNIRAVLEVAAVELISSKLSGEDLSKLRMLAGVFEESISIGTVTDQEAANRAFHMEMLKTCANRDLVELIFDLRDKIPLSVQRQKYNIVMIQRSAREHFQMVDLLSSGDRSALAVLARQHALSSLF